MKHFNTARYRISILVVMVMLLQVLLPAMGDVVWAEETTFKIEVGEIDEGKTTIKWEFELDPDKEMGSETYKYDLGFTLDEAVKDKELEGKDEEGNEATIGTYSISTDGQLTVNIDGKLYDVFQNEEGAEEVSETEDAINDLDEELQEVDETEEDEDVEETVGKALGIVASISDNFENLFISESKANTFRYWGIIEVEGIKEETANKPELGLFGGESGTDLGSVEGFEYKINLYLDSDDAPIGNGEVIEIEVIDLLTYRVDFSIPDGFTFTNGEYLNLSLESLTNIKGFSLPENELSGRIKFQIDGKSIDAAGYTVENDTLKITFDKGTELNGKSGRNGFVELGFDVEETSEEVEVIEKIDLVGTETKTFYILRKYSDVNSITKDGAYDSETDKITWAIDVNKDLNDLENAILTDNIPTGLTVEKIELYDLKITVVGEETKIEETYNKAIGLESEDVSINENELKITLGDLNRVAKRIKIITSIDDGQSGNLEFNNTATLKSNNKGEISDSKSVSLNRVTGISKSGKWSGSGNKITWTIEFRGDGSEKSYDLIDTPELPDGIGLVVIGGSVKLNGDKNHSITVKTTGDGKFIFESIPNSMELQTLEFETEVVYKSNNSGEFTIKNIAEYNEEEAEDSVEIIRGEILSKDNGKVHGENGETYVDWKIEINKNNESWTNVEIWEYIPEGFEFVSARIDKGKLGDITKDLKDSEGKDYIKIPIEETINEKRTITVKTKLTDLEKLNDIESVKNRAKIKWKPDTSGGIGIGIGDIDEGGYENDVEGEFQKGSFTHTLSKSNTGINYEEQTTSWKVEYNTYDARIENLVVEDELVEIIGDHKYDKNSLKLTLNGVEYNLNEIGENKTVTKGDKTLNYDLSFDGNNQKFTLKIISGNINTYHNKVILTYVTSFDLSKMNDSDTSLVLKNSVTASNNENKLGPIGKEASITNYISKNGRKSVEKNPGENRIFNWKVELNHKGKNISKENKITDTLTGKQKYIEDSIEIYRAELQPDGKLEEIEPALSEGEGGAYTLTIAHVTEGEEGEELLDPYDSGMEIVFTNALTTPIIIEYQTEAVGISEENYKNKINYNGKDYYNNIRYGEFNKYITKELLNSRSGNVVKGDILKWELVINESLSEIRNFELKDIMSEGLVFIKGSLKICHGETDVTNEFTIGDLSEGENGFKINKDLLDKKYTIEYETLVTADKEVGSISNDVYISGNTFEESFVKQSNYNVISRSSAGGSGYSDNDYEVKIIKVDVSGSPISEVVKFKLITETKIGDETYTSEEELTTNSNGELTINLEKNDYNTYYIEEIEAPEGYILLDEKIVINLDGETKDIEIRIVNIQKTEITGKKVWVNGPEQKPSIQIQLYRQIENGELEKVGEPVTLHGTEENPWTYTWEDLAKTDINGKEYKYTIDEVETPENYGKSKSEDGKTITNTYKIRETEITGRKIWQGGPTPRPTIKLQLYRDGEPFDDPVELKDGKTSHTWKVDRTDINGKEYEYTVDEVEVPENYKKLDSENETEVINQYVSPKTSITGTKVWEGGPSKRPIIELQLYRSVDNVTKEKVGKPIQLEDGQTKYTWEGLDLTDQKGVEYKYTIDEIKTPNNYRKSISEDGLTITNRYRPPTPPGPGPGGPTDPDKPEPEDPEKPTDPEDPDKPDKPKEEDPEDPKDPEEPEKPGEEEPDEPTDPEDNEEPEEPKPEEPNKPEKPEKPTVTNPPEYGRVEFDEDGNWIYIPDPNAPRGKIKFTIKHPDGREETIEIDLDKIPLGTTQITEKDIKLPKTGENNYIFFYFTGLALITLGFIFRRKRA